MTTLGGTFLTYADLATRQDSKGMEQMIAEVINQDNGLPNDMPMMASNEVMQHRVPIRTGLPTVHTRRLNQGVAPSKSSTSVIRETMTLLESRSHVDDKVLQLSANPAQTRMSEGKSFVEANIQKVTDLVLHGDPTTSSGSDFLGLEGRYNALTGSNISDNVLSASVTPSGSDNSSIYIVGWGDNVHGIYPMNVPSGGLKHYDRGLQQVPDVSASTAVNHGSPMLDAYVDVWQWDVGLVVKDWRYVVRIANVQADDALGLSTDQELTDYATNIRYLISDGLERIPTIGNARICIYMPRTVKIAMKKMNKALTSANVFETERVDQRPVTTFEGYEVKVLDQLTYTEAAVS